MTLIIREIRNNKYVYDYRTVDGKTEAIYLGKVGEEKTEQRVADLGSERRFQVKDKDKKALNLMDQGLTGYLIDKGRKTLSRKKEEPIDEPREFKPPSRSMNLDLPPEP
ncbi:MAG: hypothetical protein FIB07_16995 [Candidatus Methanoperedens sp.]|nr:hypothetical protein [Candidatus Methanoperedens sp.]